MEKAGVMSSIRKNVTAGVGDSDIILVNRVDKTRWYLAMNMDQHLNCVWITSAPQHQVH